MGDLLARLHDADNSRLRFIIAIGRDSFVGLLVLFLGFFGLDLVDLDAVFGIGEIQIHGECIAAVDVAASRRLGQHSIFRAGKRL